MIRYLLLLISFLTSGSSWADKIHDPTQPKTGLVVSPSSQKNEVETEQLSTDAINLQGILNKKHTKIAIISGLKYAKGDKVGGYVISQINKDNVVLISGGKQKRLYVYE